MANNKPMLLEMVDVGVFRNHRWLVKDISLKLHRAEIVTLIGPNGSGKTTTAKMVLNILKPDSGHIWRQKNIKTAYVPQKLAIDQSLPLTLTRLIEITSDISQDELAELLALVGMEKLAQAQLHDLSGGELQRALLARAIAQKPDILVLDEPLQGVDFSGEAELYSLIASLKDKLNCAILLISHDLHIVMAATDWVLCLNGHICCSGTPEHIKSLPIYSELFDHSAPNLAFYRHHHDHKH